jgi:hypothetical protein
MAALLGGRKLELLGVPMTEDIEMPNVCGVLSSSQNDGLEVHTAI